MNMPLHRPWTPEVFLDWAERQDGRFEFDGMEPVDVTGGTLVHNTIVQNIMIWLRNNLRGTAARVFTDVGLSTAGRAIRYPDVFITMSDAPGTARVVNEATVAFEVISPSTARNDRLVKLKEYAKVPTLLRYIIVETAMVGVSVYSRENAEQAWCVQVLPEPSDLLLIPEFGASVPVSVLYELTGILASTGEENAAPPH